MHSEANASYDAEKPKDGEISCSCDVAAKVERIFEDKKLI
jgi:hypothetical protein